ncbi:hypothetical protein J1N35_005049 [Gossypium stocksii]|uniref:DUF4283 domain-containing protein n=1 Tax=Gossypium stocksii TaxID=47602 RepID=A0A9D3WC45_9ROSI|nr:hypothetical protein J1N35_005049 [Gossypium stocksii]
MENELADLSLEDGEEEVLLCNPLPGDNTMVNLWHPLRGVQISDLGRRGFCLDFFIDQVLNGAPWTFNNHLLVIHHLEDGEDPMKLGDFIGKFLEYDGSIKESCCDYSVWLRVEGEGEIIRNTLGHFDLGWGSEEGERKS